MGRVNQRASRGASVAREPRRWIAVTAFAVAVAIAAGASIVVVQHHARAKLEVAHSLARVSSLANEISRIEWTGTAGGIDPATAQADGTNASVKLATTLAGVPQSSPGAASVRTSANDYIAAVRDELAARVAGRDEVAERIDEERVDPSFERLDTAIQSASAGATRQAYRSGKMGDVATVGILVLAALTLGMLFWRFDRTRKIAYQAYRDPLTDLANRTLLTDRMTHALTLAERRGENVAAVFLDLDDFKTVNDSLGHAAGDALLVELAGRIRSCARESDTVARFGGDEFAIMLEGVTDASVVEGFCARLSLDLRRPVTVAGRPIIPRATLGYAISESGATDPEALLRNADLAMYSGKRDSKGSITAFEPEMHRHLLERLELEAELREALALGQLSLEYQPLVDLDTGVMVSTEALLRWHHPRLGTVPPLTFVPMAERSGAIREIGAWVLMQACRQTADWQARHPHESPLTVSVNVSPVQFQDPHFEEIVTQALDASGLEAQYLTLEITESVIAERHEALAEQLERLSARGVKLAIDDFGTGYSSLSTLHQFPVNVLKIDKSFVDDVPDRVERLALLRSIVDLGRSLGLTTVAEGIEVTAQVSALQDLGCRQAQGFLYSRPLTPEVLGGMLDRPQLPLLTADESVSAPSESRRSGHDGRPVSQVCLPTLAQRLPDPRPPVRRRHESAPSARIGANDRPSRTDDRDARSRGRVDPRDLDRSR